MRGEEHAGGKIKKKKEQAGTELGKGGAAEGA